MIRFPYKSFAVQGTRSGLYETIYRPIIPVGIHGPSGKDEVRGLVDTGAVDTLFPDDFIDELGVVILPRDHAMIAGIDGRMTVVRYGTVDLAIPGLGAGNRWSAKVGFHAGHRIVLGHNGFLEFFTASFNGRVR